MFILEIRECEFGHEILQLMLLEYYLYSINTGDILQVGLQDSEISESASEWHPN